MTHIDLNNFVTQFKDVLLEQLSESNPSVYHQDNASDYRTSILQTLKRIPFKAQANIVQAIIALLLDKHAPAAIINAEMGTGKTMMAIATFWMLYCEANYKRNLIISPPHLVYKWRREILETVPNARVWVLNGPDTLCKLLKLRQELNIGLTSDVPEFYVLGRVRMRMGYHWHHIVHPKKVYQKTNAHNANEPGVKQFSVREVASCPDCFKPYLDSDGEMVSMASFTYQDKRIKCEYCDSPFWSLMRPKKNTANSFRERVKKSMCQIPTIQQVLFHDLTSYKNIHFQK